MGVFQQDIVSIAEGAKLLLDEHRTQGLSGAWSIGELRLADDDHRRLVAWLVRHDEQDLDSWLNTSGPSGLHDVTRHEATGLLALATIAEEARRTSAPHMLWPTLAALVGGGRRARVLLQGRQPSVGLKIAIMAACRRFNLRHRPAAGDEQAYYVTACLQFGLARSFTSQLPMWLASSQVPEAVRLLLEGDERSVSFSDLWRALKRAKSAPEEARSVAKDSPWLRSSWADAFVAAACQPPPHSSARPAVSPAVLEHDRQLVDQVVMSGRPGGARILLTAQVLRLPVLSASAGGLCLLANGEEKADLAPGVDGRYDPSPARIELPLCDEVLIELASPEAPDAVFASQLLYPLGLDDEVVVLQKGPQVLGIPSDAEVVPEEVASRRVGARRLVVVEGSAAVRVQRNGRTLWDSRGPVVQHQPPPRPTSVDVPATAWLLGADRHPISPDEELDLSALRWPIRVSAGAGWLLDGERLLRPSGSRPVRLTGVAGRGEPLVHRAGPLLPQHDAADSVLAGAVVNHGWVNGAEHARGTWRIQTTSGEPDASWRVVVWLRSGAWETQPFRTDAGGVLVDAPEDVRAIGLVAGDEVKGTFWTSAWSEDLPGGDGAETARTSVAIRWLRLPMLQAPHRSRVADFLASHLPTVLRAWSSLEVDLPGGEAKRMLLCDEPWLSCVRSLLPPGDPPYEDDVIQQLGERLSEGLRERLAPRLVALDPHLYLAYNGARLRREPRRKTAHLSDLLHVLMPSEHLDRTRLVRQLKERARCQIRASLREPGFEAVAELVHSDVVAGPRRVALALPSFRDARTHSRAVTLFGAKTE